MKKNIKLDNIIVNYKEYGKDNKEVILILHGWGGSSDSWVKVGKLLEKENYRVIIPDLPGSTKVELSRIYTLEDISILIEGLVKKIGLNNIVLWGHSNGGAVAIELATRLNLEIKKLILNNSAGIRKDIKRNFKRKILLNIVKMLKPLKKIKSFNKSRELFYKAIGSHDYLKAEINPCLKQTYLNMIDSDLQLKMKELKYETLLIWGENDSYTPISDAKKINKLIKDSKLIVLNNERHGIHLDNPKRLVEVFIKNN